MIELLIILAIVWIVFAVIQDFRSREVANWLNFSLVVFALAARLFYSIFVNNFDYFLFGILGFGLFFILGHLFYHLRVFAGGDAKLLIALGSVIGFSADLHTNILIFMLFLIFFLFAGAVYSLVYSFVLAVLNFKNFIKEFKVLFKKHSLRTYIAWIFGIVFLEGGIYFREVALIIISVLLVIFPLLYFYTKAIEVSCLVKRIPVSKVRAGDWLVEEVIIRKRSISPNWEGLNESQVEWIKKYGKESILIKEGIPFTPSFLIAFLAIVAVQYFGYANWASVFWLF